MNIYNVWRAFTLLHWNSSYKYVFILHKYDACLFESLKEELKETERFPKKKANFQNIIGKLSLKSNSANVTMDMMLYYELRITSYMNEFLHFSYGMCE